ncbi:MAG: WD40 repeat domain-containing protein, partial [Anaerolineales bacterium]|nr:WD40 repeat domain-containing protein [Anaerolineales bacterium]
RNVAVAEGHARATAQYEAIAESEMRATQQTIAEEQSRIAIEQSELATSRFLSAESLAKKDDQLDVALLLAIKAAKTSPTTAARGSLLAALSARPNLETILTKQNAVYVHALGLSEDGNTLAASYYRRIEIWDLETGSLIIELATPEDLEEYLGLTFVSDAERLLGCKVDKTDSTTRTSCRIWDINSGEELGLPITGIEGSLSLVSSSLAVSPDGELASISDRDNYVYIYSLNESRRLFGPLASHDNRITNAVFSPDGTILATGDLDGKIVLWNVKTGERIGNRIRVLAEEDEDSVKGVTGLAFSPDGELILAAGNDKSVLFYTDSIKLKKRFSGYDSDEILAHFTPEGRPVVFVKRENYYILWDASTGSLVGGRPNTSFFTGEMEDEVLDPVHMRLITASKLTTVWGANILIWDLEHRLPFERHIAQDLQFETVTYHPKAEPPFLAAGGGCEEETDSEESLCFGGVVYFWDAESGEQIGEPLLGHTDQIEDLTFSPDGALLATSSHDVNIILWDMETREPIGDPLSGHENGVHSVEFSPDGQLLASASPSDPVAVRLWDLTQEPPTSELLGADYEYLDNYDTLAFSKDGNTLAVCGTGDFGSRVTLWDVSSLSLISHLDSDRKNRASEVVIFGPDGRTLLTAGSAGVRIWDYLNQEVLAEPPSESMEPPRLESIALSPDGKLLAALQLHNGLTFWDGVTGQLIAPPISTPEKGTYIFENSRIAFSPEGEQLAIVGDFGILLWDMQLESWIEAACKMANRDLTLMEWRTYLGDRPYEETCPNPP